MNHTIHTAIDLAQTIDHTLLKPTLSEVDVLQLCREALNYSFKTVCLPPCWVKTAVAFLQAEAATAAAPRQLNPKPTVITVVGFPLGYSLSETKSIETVQAIDAGASEIDLVMNISELKSQHPQVVAADIRQVVRAAGAVPVKVIIETAYLTASEIEQAALMAEAEGARFVKTSTGFATGVPHSGARVDDIRHLRSLLKPQTLLKASGGIRDLPTTLEFLAAGADRIGTSSGVSIIEAWKEKNGG